MSRRFLQSNYINIGIFFGAICLIRMVSDFSQQINNAGYWCMQFINVFIFLHAIKYSVKLLVPEGRDLYKEYFWIFICIIVAALPFLFNGFYYYDDLWGFTGNTLPQVGILMRRPFIDFVIAFFSFITVDNSYIMRSFIIFVHVIFSFLLFVFIYKTIGNKNKSLVLVILLCCNTVFIDCVGYLSIFPVAFAEYYTALSFIYYNKWHNEAGHSFDKSKREHWLDLFLSILFLISACMYYQIITSLFGLFIAIEIIEACGHKKRLDWKKYCIWFVEYAICILIYLGITKLLIELFQMPIVNRGVIINSWEEFIMKIDWFATTVFPTALAHVFGGLFSNTLFSHVCMFYELSYKSHIIKSLLYVLSSMVFVVMGWRIVKKQLYFNLIGMLLLIPISFYAFLLITESSITSYYIYPLFLIVALYFYYGLEILTELFAFDKAKRSLSVLLIILTVISSNYYADVFWVKYNVSGYEFLRNTISAQMSDNIKRIHVYGKLAPPQANVYAIMASKLVLDELHLNGQQYVLTSSDNEYYMSVLTKEERDHAYSCLNDQEKEIFANLYECDPIYMQYRIKQTNLPLDTLLLLQNIFQKSGLIPLGHDENLILVNLISWQKFNRF